MRIAHMLHRAVTSTLLSPFVALTIFLAISPTQSLAQTKPEAPAAFDVKAHYTKYEYRVPMRDGKRLFTAVYIPKDQSKTHPILMVRTPYSVSPYGADEYRERLGPSTDFDRTGYIFVFQDVRGRNSSEGTFIDMTPHKAKKSAGDVDESTDMFDSAEWLLKNVSNHNGRIGLWGISYPGFYVSASIIDSHPAIKAASPQAPVTDMFMNDDSYHGGAFMLAANFGFYTSFKQQQNPLAKPEKWEPFDYGTKDGYEFFLKYGTLANLDALINKPEYFMWKGGISNDTYNEYWQTRNIAPHLKNIKAAVLTVGGWFDAEDPQGPLTTYRTIKANNPGIYNGLVMGPWVHGAWSRLNGEHIGIVRFNAKTSEYYQKNILLPFFEKHLKDKSDIKLAEVHVFETGTNVWRQFPAWPPANARTKTLYFAEGGKLSWTQPGNAKTAFDEYVSDPAKPVPYVSYPSTGVAQEYVVGDQRFASSRTDVLTYQSDILEDDVTLAGAITPKLFIASTGSDSDFVVKLIDVYPPERGNGNTGDGNDDDEKSAGKPERKDVAVPKNTLAGYQQLVRGEPLRAKFRFSFSQPQALTPNKVERITFNMGDMFHTFRRGHRIMVQVQSSWFPLIDRNPQVFMRIPDAKPEDFKIATQRVYRTGSEVSGIELAILDRR
jgi:uncharacterized protein